MTKSDSHIPSGVLLSVESAQKVVLERIQPLGIEIIGLDEALGRVTAEDVRADIDIPAFDNSAMDGYAVRSGDLVYASKSTPVALRVKGTELAGVVFSGAIGQGEAVRIMTGAPLPPGADSVVMVEDTHSDSRESVHVLCPVDPGENVRRAGEDVRRADIVVGRGSVIRPAEMGMMAGVGYTHPTVFRRPRIALITTGSEIVEASQMPAAGQTRNSNRYSTLGQVLALGVEVASVAHVPDDADKLRAALESASLEADAIITCGGVSVGEADIVKDVLSATGDINFWRVAVKPGKPFAFGQINSVPLFGLPGNPVSSLVTFDLFVGPALRKMGGHCRLLPQALEAVAERPISHVPGREEYVRAVITKVGDRLSVLPTRAQGSHQLSSMTGANCYAVIESERGDVAPGESVPIILMNQQGSPALLRNPEEY
ncbi:MAG: molybdopterin molybdotransferase MoeA [Armatimonadetes bacterium]|nr:molybdopterin molybdotransferase MoeA [Armatimonadota bacterium]